MKAIQLEQPKAFREIDLPEPAAPGPGDAVVRVFRVGVCGTDYSGYLGKMPFFSYPRIPGHELGVEVVAVGDGVTNVKPGDKAAVEPYINCQRCYSCARGHTNCCENHQTLGVHVDGGLRPLFAVPARKLHVSTKLSYEQLALVETLGIGLHAINRANPRADETVFVIGAGPIGLSVVEFAKLAGARVIVMDLNEGRLQFVREKMGVTDTILSRGVLDEDVKTFTDLTGGKLGNVVVDATGSAQEHEQRVPVRRVHRAAGVGGHHAGRVALHATADASPRDDVHGESQRAGARVHAHHPADRGRDAGHAALGDTPRGDGELNRCLPDVAEAGNRRREGDGRGELEGVQEWCSVG